MACGDSLAQVAQWCAKMAECVWHPKWGEPIVRADGARARKCAIDMAKEIEIDPEGITTNAWRESEWCLFTDEDLDGLIDGFQIRNTLIFLWYVPVLVIHLMSHTFPKESSK